MKERETESDIYIYIFQRKRERIAKKGERGKKEIEKGREGD